MDGQHGKQYHQPKRIPLLVSLESVGRCLDTLKSPTHPQHQSDTKYRTLQTISGSNDESPLQVGLCPCVVTVQYQIFFEALQLQPRSGLDHVMSLAFLFLAIFLLHLAPRLDGTDGVLQNRCSSSLAHHIVVLALPQQVTQKVKHQSKPLLMSIPNSLSQHQKLQILPLPSFTPGGMCILQYPILLGP